MRENGETIGLLYHATGTGKTVTAVMDAMSYSYKPVLVTAILLYADEKGHVKLCDIVSYFRDFYERRRAAGRGVGGGGGMMRPSSQGS